MRERVQSELRGSDISNMQVETFHAYCNNLLIRNRKKFGALDDKDIWIYLRRRIRELRLNYFVRAANLSQFLNDLLDFMRRCHDELVGPEQYSEYLRRVELGELPAPRVCKSKHAGSLSDHEALGRCREISIVFATVERMLHEDNLGTFGHMITRAYSLLEADANLLAQEQQRARFILVDEFQDANFAQVKILEKLAGQERNVFAVGDPDQAIYKFRGASSAAFALFQHHFGGTKLVALEKNRRSTSPILNCAFALISKNPEIPGKAKGNLYPRSPLVSAREEEATRDAKPLQSNPVDVVLLTAREVETSDLINQIQQRQRQTRAPWSDFAVLYRLHSHRDLLAAEFAEHGIPFSIENMDVMDTPEARDLFACIGAIVSTQDGASLFRVASFPRFRINPEALRAAIKALPKEHQNSGLADVLVKIEGGSAVLDALHQAREEVASAGGKGRSALEIIMRIFSLDRSTAPANAVLNWVAEWEKKVITKTRELAELLEYLAYFREADGSIPMPSREENAVRLMTAHSAKGLEFKHVFILRANSNSFPTSYKEPLFELPRELRDRDSLAEEDEKELFNQEERRLFYVAMTRARDSLTIYARQGKGTDSTPPGFLRDLLKDRALTRWLRRRHARPFQTDMFAEAPAALAESPSAQWLNLPPSSDLSNRLSATAVQSYEMCPLRFKLEREWGLPREVPAAMQYGAVMHRVLRAYYDSVRFDKPHSDEALINLFRSDLAEAGIQDRYQYELYQKQGIAQLREFVAASRQAAFPDVAHTEEFLEVRIGKATVVGRIDRIDRRGNGEVTITDYKTGKPQSQEDADESLQLSIYALAAREKWGYRAERLVFYNLEENAAVITSRSELQLREAKLKVEDVAENVAAGRFEPKPGFYCNFCSYRNLCPATEKRVFGPVQTKKHIRN